MNPDAPIPYKVAGALPYVLTPKALEYLRKRGCGR